MRKTLSESPYRRLPVGGRSLEDVRDELIDDQRNERSLDLGEQLRRFVVLEGREGAVERHALVERVRETHLDGDRQAVQQRVFVARHRGGRRGVVRDLALEGEIAPLVHLRQARPAREDIDQRLGERRTQNGRHHRGVVGEIGHREGLGVGRDRRVWSRSLFDDHCRRYESS